MAKAVLKREDEPARAQYSLRDFGGSHGRRALDGYDDQIDRTRQLFLLRSMQRLWIGNPLAGRILRAQHLKAAAPNEIEVVCPGGNDGDVDVFAARQGTRYK